MHFLTGLSIALHKLPSMALAQPCTKIYMYVMVNPKLDNAIIWKFIFKREAKEIGDICTQATGLVAIYWINVSKKKKTCHLLDSKISNE